MEAVDARCSEMDEFGFLGSPVAGVAEAEKVTTKAHIRRLYQMMEVLFFRVKSIEQRQHFV